MEQSSGRSWVFVVVSREVWGLRDGTPPNKGKKNTSKQGKKTPTNKKKTPTNKEKTPPNKKKNTNKQGKTFPNKEKHQQTRKIPFEQGKRLSSKGYLPIKCKSLRVVGVSGQGKAKETKGNGRRRWRGVGPAGRPFPILLWR